MELLTTLQWILVALFVGPILYFGYAKMMAEPAKISKFATWGYPIKTMQILSVIEIIGAVSILFPELRLFGIAIWAIILVGSVFAKVIHLKSMKELYTVLTILVHLALILALNIWINTAIK